MPLPRREDVVVNPQLEKLQYLKESSWMEVKSVNVASCLAPGPKKLIRVRPSRFNYLAHKLGVAIRIHSLRFEEV